MTYTRTPNFKLQRTVNGADMNTGNPRAKLERTFSPQSVIDHPYNYTSDGSELPVHPERSIQRIRFRHSVAVRFIRSRRKYTPQQIRSCWYQSHEFREIAEECIQDLHKKIQNDADDQTEIEDETFCIRGLENYIESAQQQKHWIRAEAANAVMNAADYGCDEITIAREYTAVADQAQRWARFVGLRDQRYAESIYKEG